MNPFEVIAQILTAPFRLVNRMVQSVPPPPGLPQLPQLGGDNLLSSTGFPQLPFLPMLPAGNGGGGSSYTNNETWTVLRDPKTNRMSGIKIIRNARAG